MTIIEALQQTGKDNGFYITRVAWNEGYPTRTYTTAIVLLVTDSPDGSMIVSQYEEGTYRIWNPRREDILADDWIATE